MLGSVNQYSAVSAVSSAIASAASATASSSQPLAPPPCQKTRQYTSISSPPHFIPSRPYLPSHPERPHRPLRRDLYRQKQKLPQMLHLLPRKCRRHQSRRLLPLTSSRRTWDYLLLSRIPDLQQLQQLFGSDFKQDQRRRLRFLRLSDQDETEGGCASHGPIYRNRRSLLPCRK